MPDHPIIFSAPMIRALLDGSKTQTRRLAWRERKCPGGPINDGGGQMDYVEPGIVRSPSPWQRVQPGDRLWVREAHALSANPDLKPWYRLDHPEARAAGPRVDVKWRPSIHMPRWASRITLHVEAVRVERLQDIREADAQAEGVSASDDPFWRPSFSDPDSGGRPSFRNSFEFLWGQLHGPDAWASNPEVVVLTFRVVKGNIDA